MISACIRIERIAVKGDLLVFLYQVFIRRNETNFTSVCNGTTLQCIIRENTPSGFTVSPNTLYFIKIVVFNTLFKTEFIKNATTKVAGM